MAEYSPLTAERFHKYLAERNIRLRISDMEDILKAADAAMEKDMDIGILNAKSETLLYQYAYEQAVLKHLEVQEMRRKYAAYEKWNGVDRRRRHCHPTDN
ncbi:MAG: hypothetical protein QW165_04250 [Candidatus Woesearchaeota archaeon]